jgi:hypothetical protein
MSERFQVNPAKVVHETIDGEAILIHLENGSYYSLAGTGAEIWGLLAAGHPVDEAAAALAGRYDAEPEELEAEVRRLAGELEDEDLLERSQGTPNGTPLPAADGGLRPFEAPRLERYDDMKDFLLVDPIHETAEAGWPHPRETA